VTETLIVGGMSLHALERCGRRVSCAKLMERPATLCWPSGGDNDRRHRRHGIDCQQGMTVLCREGSEMPEHAAGIKFSLEPATSGVH